MYALKSNLKNYSAIFLLYYVLRCITIVSTHPPGLYINLPVSYDINPPHNQRALIANSNDGEYLQMPSREQHPWERRPIAHHHGRPLHHQNNLNIKTQTSESSSEECVQCRTESRATINAPIYGFAHRDRSFPATRLNGNALDTEIGAYEQHHPWRVQRPHRRHKFHQRRGHAGHFEQDNDESSGENEQVDTNADSAKTPCNDWRKSVEPMNTNGGSPKEEAEIDSITAATGTAKTPCRRHRFHHRRWPAGHFERDNDESNEENEQGDTTADRAKTHGRRHRFHHRRWPADHFKPDYDESNEENEQVDTTADRLKTPGNNWRESLEPMNPNGGSSKKDAEMDSTTAAIGTAKETTTPTTIATTAISEGITSPIEKITNSQEVQTTAVVNSLTTPTTDNTSTPETTEAAQSIDIRRGFA